MTILLSEQTQKLLEEQMRRDGQQSPDDVVRMALETLREVQSEEISDEIHAAIEQGLAEHRRGEGRPWEEVREELRKRFIDK